jgi:Flp pilus assembly pilin Flp
MRRHHVSGQGLTEYALILALVAVALMGSLVVFKDTLDAAYTMIAAAIP